ncbi:HEAT repeat domain-containing protein [Pleurocapsa sp. PCC 7319]|uniref:HEAT repeat domain-containing protein n=1 Tax=Pleurocapsa sp. PCC 7319 TaxID=118161 RepID=UPI000476B64C|nr:HEAT repeat domain-containing protein [Pleurocapsa sp. PCC 7319]
MTTDAIFEKLKHPNPNLRRKAMLELAEARDENTIPRLMSILNQEDVTYRRAAVKALGIIGADVVPSVVDSLLNSDNATVRSSCAKALAQVVVNHPEVQMPEEGIQGLKQALNDPNPVVNIPAVMTLGEIGPPVFDLLVETLNTSENLAVGVAILNALGSMGDPRGVEVLTNLSNDESADPYIQESATSALSRLEMVMKYNS